MKKKNVQEKDESWEEAELKTLAEPVRVAAEGAIVEEDIDFVQDCRGLLRRQKMGWRGWLPFFSVSLVAILLWWASWAELEEVTRGIGKVIPSKSVQLIQSLEGGILEEIYVKEGERVQKGQPLIHIRDAIFAANYKENCAKRDELIARIARLDAETDGFKTLVMPEGIRLEAAMIEQNLFAKRKADYEATRKALSERLILAKREEELMEAGRESKAISPVELIRVQKEVTELEGQLAVLETKTQREAMESLDKDNADLMALEHAIQRDKDRLDRTLIKSPVRGTVNKIHIDTTGRVIASGMDIMAIVPLDDTLLIEANIKPSDIAFIRPDLDAMVKFTAYDFAVYGGLPGKVEQLSVDTITDEKGESFYQIKIRTDEATLGQDKHGQELEIIPGMVAEVDIVTGKKTILTYLLKPLTRARERALRER